MISTSLRPGYRPEAYAFRGKAIYANLTGRKLRQAVLDAEANGVDVRPGPPINAQLELQLEDRTEESNEASNETSPEARLEGELSLAAASIDPRKMGIGQMEHARRNQREIARISYESVLGDIVCIWVSILRDGYEYIILDDNERCEVLRRSELPLTLAEVIAMIDETVDPIGALELTEPDTLECVDELEGFITVESYFYPELEQYYEERINDWLEERRRTLGGAGT
jgi:hypothetical protein